MFCFFFLLVLKFGVCQNFTDFIILLFNKLNQFESFKKKNSKQSRNAKGSGGNRSGSGGRGAKQSTDLRHQAAPIYCTFSHDRADRLMMPGSIFGEETPMLGPARGVKIGKVELAL